MSKFPSTSSILLLGFVETNSSNISVVKGETMKAKSSKESIILVNIGREKRIPRGTLSSEGERIFNGFGTA
jgi:hypothetical protein